MAIKNFDDTTLRNIADFISDVLTHRQINDKFSECGISDAAPDRSKTDRVFYSLKQKQAEDKCGNNVLALVMKIVTPKRYNDEAKFESDRNSINEKLLYEGIEIGKDGQPRNVKKANYITEAKERSQKIKRKIGGLNLHADAIKFCEEEWLKENYFHAVLESTKSVAEKLRTMSGYKTDGSEIVENCFGLGKDKKPKLAINKLSNPSEESEQKGFSNFIKGFFSMYRNPKAHNPKINEDTQLNELIEVLIIASLIHKKLDNTFKTGYK